MCHFICDTAKLAEPDKGKDGKDTVTFIPVNEQLKTLGVTAFSLQRTYAITGP
jgi:hypothetical protein